MTCRRVPWVHPTCTCGALLQLGVDHGDDELGNPLCPTCSGCGCEPEERKTMTPKELDALPDDAIVLIEGDPMMKVAGSWKYLTPQKSVSLSSDVLLEYETRVLLHPVPEPDHSMCVIEPRPEHYRSTIAVDISEPQTHGRRWVYPAGHNNAVAMFDEEVIAAGGSIPDPEPTVVERAIEVASSIPLKWDNGTPIEMMLDADTAAVVVAAFLDAGLLVRDNA